MELKLPFCFLVITIIFAMHRSEAGSTGESDVSQELANTKSLLKQIMANNRLLKKQNKRLKQVWRALEQMCKALNAQTENQTQEQSQKEAPKQGTRHYNSSAETFVSTLPEAVSSPVFFVVRHKDTEMVATVAGYPVLKVQKLSLPEVTIEKLKTPIVAPLNTSLTAIFLVNANASEYRFETSARFEGFDGSSEPPRYFRVNSYSRFVRTTHFSMTENNWNVSVEIDNTLSRYGGILTLELRFLPSSISHYIILQGVRYSKEYEIFTNISSTLTVIQRGMLGFKHLPTTTLLTLPEQSITCRVMGNPRPDVFLSKVTNKEYVDVTTLLRVVQTDFITEKIYSLSATDPYVEGNYVCRVPASDETEQELGDLTEVLVYKEGAVNKAASGVKTNNSDKVEIVCQVTGKPKPEVKLTLYYKFGPDLTKSSRYEVTRRSPDAETKEVVLTISPVDTDVHRVDCISEQYYEGVTLFDDLMITVFPSGRSNMELFHELFAETT